MVTTQREGNTAWITPEGRADRTAAHNGWPSDAVLMADTQSIHVEFTVKELLSKIEKHLGDIDDKLDGKANHIALVDLHKRVLSLEEYRAYNRGLGRATWAIVGLLVAIAGLLIPVVMQAIAGGLV